MATIDTSFDAKMEELLQQVQDLEAKTAAFKAFVQPAFELTEFHKHYDPMTEAAKKSHDIYHELLGLRGHAHH